MPYGLAGKYITISDTIKISNKLKVTVILLLYNTPVGEAPYASFVVILVMW